MFRQNAVRNLISLLIVLLFLAYASGLLEGRLIRRLDNFVYDVRLALTMPEGQDTRVVIVDIDERSLAREGRWPWPRHRLAALVDQLFDHYQIALLGTDVVFAERDESSGLKVLEQLAQDPLKDNGDFLQVLEALRPSLDRDRAFADSLQGRRVVLGYYFSSYGNAEEAHGSEQSGVLPDPVASSDGWAVQGGFISALGYGANLPELQRNALGAGHFNPLVDEDGVVRRVPMLIEYRGGLYEALSLAMVRAYLGIDGIVPVVAEGLGTEGGYAGLEYLLAGDRRIPVDEVASTLVPYRGRQGSFPYVSATDVLEGVADPALFRNAIVLLGTSAPGLLDLRSVPVQNVYAGVEIHANVIAGILDGTLKEKPAYVPGAEFALLLLLGIALPLTLNRLSAASAAAVTVVLASGLVAGNLAAWQYGNLALPLASLLLLVLTLFVFNMSYGYFVESRSKRFIARRFGQYVPPEIVDEMSRNPKVFTLEGESREMTVLFSDVRNFTSISEPLDPKQLSQLMNEFLTPITRAIHAHRGTIDKYMGDAVMAFWGAPLADPDHARHALEAAVAMVRELQELRSRFQERGWPEIRIGIGINTGVMSVGNMGSEFRMAYTVLGDAVNLGSRIEGLTKQYGVSIIVSETTKNGAAEFVFRELDQVRVKGKDRPVRIYEPIGRVGAVSQTALDELAVYHTALACYRARDFDAAEKALLKLLEIAPECYLYRVYLNRIGYFRSSPPPAEWDGTFTFETK